MELCTVSVQVQEFSLQSAVRLQEVLHFFASLYPSPRAVNELLEEFGLKQKKKSNFSSLSGGQKRRLALAIALIGNPSLVVLDEPAAGLDLQGQAFLKKQINMLREQEVTVLLSTHNVDDATRLADQVIMMAQGHVVAQGSVADLVREHCLAWCLEVKGDLPSEAKRSPSIKVVENANLSNHRTIYTQSQQHFESLFPDVEVIQSREATLQDVYFLLTDNRLI